MEQFCFGEKCKGDGNTTDDSFSVFPLNKERGTRCCNKCSSLVIKNRDEYLNKCVSYFKNTGQQIALQEGCAYCGNNGGFRVTYGKDNTHQTQYGEFCSMSCSSRDNDQRLCV